MSRISNNFVRRGFTLVELMVVIGIIGVIIALAVPNFAATQRRVRINAAAQEIAQDIRQFRERALSGGINYRVERIDSRTYQIVKVIRPDSTLTLTRRLAEATGGNIRFGVVGSVVSVPSEANSASPPASGFDFLPAGVLAINSRGGATRGVIYINDGFQNYAVGINTLGRVRVYRYNKNNNTWN